MANKIKVLIVDDEPLARRGIRQLLEFENEFEIVGEARNGREAVVLVARLRPDLVFLDIQMPLLDGFAFVEEIEESKLPEIVFVTAFDEHAIKGFEAGAVDYILKPINRDRFHKTLTRVRRRILSGDARTLDRKLDALASSLRQSKVAHLERIVVKENERIRFVPVEKVDWISSQGNYIEIHSGEERYLVRETMNGIETKLNPRDFLRIRRSAIVRIDRISELHPLFGGELEVVLKSGLKLTSSRRYRKNLDNLLKI